AGLEGENPVEGGLKSLRATTREIGGLPPEEGEEIVSGEDIAGSLGMEEGIPRTLTGVGVEMLTDPLTYAGGGLGKILQKSAYKGAIKKAGRAFSRFAKESDLKKGIDPELIGKQMFLDDISKHINNPAKLYKLLTGKSIFKSIGPEGIPVVGKAKVTRGLIGDLTDQVTDIAAKADIELGSKIEVDDIIAKASESIQSEVLERAGLSVNQEELLNNIPLMLRTALANRGGIKAASSLSRVELLEAKRRLGKAIKSADIFKGADEAVAIEKAVNIGLERTLKESLTDSVKGLNLPDGNAAQVLDSLNRKAHYYMQAKDLLKGIPLKELQKKQTGELVAQGLTGLTTGGIMGAGLSMAGAGTQIIPYSAAMGGIFSTSSTISKIAAEKAPAAISRGLKVMGDVAPAAGALIPQLGREMGRKPQSVDPVFSEGEMPQDIDEVFIQMRFPRTTEGVLQNKEAFLQKVKLSDTENYDAVKTILESSPAELQAVLPTLTKTMPYLFEYDEYGRFDGKVPQEMRASTVKKIWDMDFSNTEKTALVDIMNRTGKLDL
ncbi:MAG: hypothetical protein HRU26_06985, partial [Psychroserpens sp.]|nr:hypothetical protein [Psychroserpens sp.]